MSKVFDAISRAQRERDAKYGRRDSNNDGHGPDDGARGWLRHRLLDWLPARRPAAVIEPRPVLPPLEIDLDATSSGDELSAILEERFASLQVAVDALDDRISSEIVEREAKFLEEIGHGMRGLEIELLHRL